MRMQLKRISILRFVNVYVYVFFVMSLADVSLFTPIIFFTVSHSLFIDPYRVMGVGDVSLGVFWVLYCCWGLSWVVFEKKVKMEILASL